MMTTEDQAMREHPAASAGGPRLRVDGVETSLASFVENNAESHALLDAVRAMSVGDVITEGGGAAPLVKIERVS